MHNFHSKAKMIDPSPAQKPSGITEFKASLELLRPRIQLNHVSSNSIAESKSVGVKANDGSSQVDAVPAQSTNRPAEARAYSAHASSELRINSHTRSVCLRLFAIPSLYTLIAQSFLVRVTSECARRVTELSPKLADYSVPNTIR